MSKTDFRGYLQSRGQPEVDWSERKAVWLASLDDLLVTVEGWLDGLEGDGVSHERVAFELAEEYMGRYAAPALSIRFRGLEVMLKPIGTNIIGAAGRADLEGFAGYVRFLRMPAGVDRPLVRGGQSGTGAAAALVWKIASEPPRVRYHVLDEDSFFEALMKVVNARPR